MLKQNKTNHLPKLKKKNLQLFSLHLIKNLTILSILKNHFNLFRTNITMLQVNLAMFHMDTKPLLFKFNSDD